MNREPSFPLIQRGLRRIRLIYDTWFPWEQKRVARKLRPLTLRLLEKEDLDWCERLYRRNASFGAPPEIIGNYSDYLRSPGHLVLIAEDPTGRVATFGLHWVDSSVAYLSFLLVDPGAHRTGVGTTLVIASLAILSRFPGEKVLTLSAIDSSIKFYQRLGFDLITTEMMEGHRIIHASLGPLPTLMLQDCATMLLRAGTIVPDFSKEFQP